MYLFAHIKINHYICISVDNGLKNLNLSQSNIN